MNPPPHPIAALLVTSIVLCAAGFNAEASESGDTSSAQAHEAPSPEGETPEVTANSEQEERRRVCWFAPPADFYPYYIADPRRSQSALLFMHPISTEIPESDGSRVGVRLGGRFALVRNHPQNDTDRGW